jgi:outer membrane murein-binding lipoprotein Lpp
MSTNTETRTSANRFRSALIIFTLAMVASVLFAACSNNDDEVARQDGLIADLASQAAQLQAQVQELEAGIATATEEANALAEDLQAAMDVPVEDVSFRVEPAFFNFPMKRLKGLGNLWFYGSGLEPGQWFTISVRAEGGEQEIPLLGGPEMVRQANDVGSFAISVNRIDARKGRFDYAGLGAEQLMAGGVFELNLEDADSREVIASTPWVVCGQARENAWCSASVDSAIIVVE